MPLKAYLTEIIDSGELSSREANVIRMRFGLDGKAPRSREELSILYGVSPERIRLVEERAIRLLGRHPSRSRKLQHHSIP